MKTRIILNVVAILVTASVAISGSALYARHEDYDAYTNAVTILRISCAAFATCVLLALATKKKGST